VRWGVAQCGAVWCSVVQRGAAWCSVVQRGTVWCSVVQCGAVCWVCCSVLQCGAVCRSVLQCATVCCSVSQGVTGCCRVLKCVAVCCSVLQYVAVCCSMLQYLPWWSPTSLPRRRVASSRGHGAELGEVAEGSVHASHSSEIHMYLYKYTKILTNDSWNLPKEPCILSKNPYTL